MLLFFKFMHDKILGDITTNFGHMTSGKMTFAPLDWLPFKLNQPLTTGRPPSEMTEI